MGPKLLFPVISFSLPSDPMHTCPKSPTVPQGLGSVGRLPTRAGGTYRAAAAAVLAAVSPLPLCFCIHTFSCESLAIRVGLGNHSACELRLWEVLSPSWL
jgi:hypothetical protein